MSRTNRQGALALAATIAVTVTLAIGIGASCASGWVGVPQSLALTSPVLGSDPATGTLDATVTPDASYQLYLGRGDLVSCVVSTSTPDSDFGVRLYGQTTQSLEETSAIVAPSTWTTTAPDRVSYRNWSRGPDPYYVNVHANSGSGGYTLRTSVRRGVEITAKPDRSTVRYGSSTVLRARARRTVGGWARYIPVRIDYSRDGKKWVNNWRRLKTGKYGEVAVRVSPKRRTYYRVRSLGTSAYFPASSPKVYVRPSIILSTPRLPDGANAWKSFTVSGTIKPRIASTSPKVRVQVYAPYYASDQWRLIKTASAKVSRSGSGSKYTVRLNLGPGRFRIRAVSSSNSLYAPSTSAMKYVEPKADGHPPLF
ncbi:MAG: hypothetical protein HY876_10815 [Coriobacteriales bacterium]|nr:hypothetical protein [Coriobacteriales bacterium]